MTTALSENPLTLLTECGGYYECPKGNDGHGHTVRLGPLVAYAQTDEYGRPLVGDIYVNFARADERPTEVLHPFAVRILQKIPCDLLESCTGFCGVPRGGINLAFTLALLSGKRFMCAEKRVIRAEGRMTREQTKFVFGRHTPRANGVWFVVEDVCSTFGSALAVAECIEHQDACVAGIICFFNRSCGIGIVRTPVFNQEIRVTALVHGYYEQYRQDDPLVMEDVAKGNLVLNPKRDWSTLQGIMKKHMPR